MIADTLLNLSAQVLLRVCAPESAHVWIRRLGGLLPERSTADQIRRAADALRGRGTCLSRSLAVAARAPRADVVIGVEPSPASASLAAHAWLEVDGVPLRPTDPAGREIARLRGRGGPAVAGARP